MLNENILIEMNLMVLYNHIDRVIPKAIKRDFNCQRIFLFTCNCNNVRSILRVLSVSYLQRNISEHV